MTPSEHDEAARHPYQRIADAVRAQIDAGRYQPGDRLPAQHELAEEHGATRETVKRALKVLQDERRIITRQGAGSFVRVITERPSGLRPHLEAAFDADEVTLDFLGFSAETLFNALAEPLDKVRHQKLTPRSIRIRLIVCDMAAALPVPSSAGEGSTDEEVRARMAKITDRSVQAIAHTASELPGASVETRALAAPPLVKLILVNGAEAWFGWYEVVKRTVSLRGEQVEIFDALGKDATLHPYTGDTDEGAAWLEGSRRWFDSWWTTAHPYEP
jgi:DNA-binding transcriptional regulator YhcF (GntR family)